MLENLGSIIKIFKYVIILFVIIFFRSILANNFIFVDFNQFVGNYLSIYQNATYLLQQSGLPMWAPNLFLGGNFLGLQNSYSIYSPFFLITLLFPSNMLTELFLPLLFVKTLLAGGALYLYLKETKWCSSLTIGIALILYLFHGWYFNYLNQFVFIELMIYVPFALFGIEYMLSRGYKRFLVAALTLLFTSHFSFSLLFSPLLFIYWWTRYRYLYRKDTVNARKQIRLMAYSIVTVIGINSVFILPMVLARNTLHLTIQGEVTSATILSTLYRTFLPSLHESFSGQLSFINVRSIALFQSVLVILLFPQFIKLISKQVRFMVISSYMLLLGLVLITQTLEIMNITGIAPFNLNVLGLLFLLFNAVIVAFVLNDAHVLDRDLLKVTSRVYKFCITLLVGFAFLYESDFLVRFLSLSSFEISKNQLLNFSPYFLIYVVMVALIDIYRYLLHLMADEQQGLRRKAVFVVILVECIMTSFTYLETHSHKSVGINTALADSDYIGNNIAAISNYLQAMDPDFHRVINSFQIHGNDPLLRDYPGFSTANRHLINEKLEWMLIESDYVGKLSDHFLTTALGAKYYLTADSVTRLPGYEYFDRIQGITIYRNRYFASIGMSSEYYVLKSDFDSLSRAQKRYVFLQAIILDDEEAYHLSEGFNLQPFNIDGIPETIGEIQYFKAAEFRQTLGIENITFANNRFTHDYTTTEPSLLVYSIPYERGWRATANGERLIIREVNNGFIGIEIPEAGAFEIVLEYRTPGLLPGLSISIVMLVLITGHVYKQKEEEKFANER